MLALAEYRRPPRAQGNFTAIGQANIAAQQVVQNGEIPASENSTNEQGPEAAGVPRRPYRLSPEGLASLRASAVRVRPWERSTGPRTPEGKARSRMNAWKHGERSAEAVASRAMFTACLRTLREHDRVLAALVRQTAHSLD